MENFGTGVHNLMALSGNPFGTAQKVGTPIGEVTTYSSDGSKGVLVTCSGRSSSTTLQVQDASLTNGSEISKSKSAYSALDSHSDVVAYTVAKKNDSKNTMVRVVSNEYGVEKPKPLLKGTEGISSLSISPLDKRFIGTVGDNCVFSLYFVNLDDAPSLSKLDAIYSKSFLSTNFIISFVLGCPDSEVSWVLFSNHSLKLVFQDASGVFREIDSENLTSSTIIAADFIDSDTLVVVSKKSSTTIASSSSFSSSTPSANAAISSIHIVKIVRDATTLKSISLKVIRSTRVDDAILCNCDGLGSKMVVTSVAAISGDCFVTSAHAFSDVSKPQVLDSFVIAWSLNFDPKTAASLSNFTPTPTDIKPKQVVRIQVPVSTPFGSSSFSSKSTISKIFDSDQNASIVVYSESLSSSVYIFTSPLSHSRASVNATSSTSSSLMPLALFTSASCQFSPLALSTSILLDRSPDEDSSILKLRRNLCLTAMYSKQNFEDTNFIIERISLPLSIFRNPSTVSQVVTNQASNPLTDSTEPSTRHLLALLDNTTATIISNTNTSNSSSSSSIGVSKGDFSSTNMLRNLIGISPASAPVIASSDSLGTKGVTSTSGGLNGDTVKTSAGTTSSQNSSLKKGSSLLKNLIGINGPSVAVAPTIVPTQQQQQQQQPLTLPSVPITVGEGGLGGKVVGDNDVEDSSSDDDSSDDDDNFPPSSSNADLPDYLINTIIKTPLQTITQNKIVTSTASSSAATSTATTLKSSSAITTTTAAAAAISTTTSTKTSTTTSSKTAAAPSIPVSTANTKPSVAAVVTLNTSTSAPKAKAKIDDPVSVASTDAKPKPNPTAAATAINTTTTATTTTSSSSKDTSVKEQPVLKTSVATKDALKGTKEKTVPVKVASDQNKSSPSPSASSANNRTSSSSSSTMLSSSDPSTSDNGLSVSLKAAPASKRPSASTSIMLAPKDGSNYSSTATATITNSSNSSNNSNSNDSLDIDGLEEKLTQTDVLRKQLVQATRRNVETIKLMNDQIKELATNGGTIGGGSNSVANSSSSSNTKIPSVTSSASAKANSNSIDSPRATDCTTPVSPLFDPSVFASIPPIARDLIVNYGRFGDAIDYLLRKSASIGSLSSSSGIDSLVALLTTLLKQESRNMQAIKPLRDDCSLQVILGAVAVLSQSVQQLVANNTDIDYHQIDSRLDITISLLGVKSQPLTIAKRAIAGHPYQQQGRGASGSLPSSPSPRSSSQSGFAAPSSPSSSPSPPPLSSSSSSLLAPLVPTPFAQLVEFQYIDMAISEINRSLDLFKTAITERIQAVLSSMQYSQSNSSGAGAMQAQTIRQVQVQKSTVEVIDRLQALLSKGEVISLSF